MVRIVLAYDPMQVIFLNIESYGMLRNAVLVCLVIRQAWMSEEDELLNRTLQRCLREVRRALDADSDVKALATCQAGHCVSGFLCCDLVISVMS